VWVTTQRPWIYPCLDAELALHKYNSKKYTLTAKKRFSLIVALFASSQHPGYIWEYVVASSNYRWREVPNYAIGVEKRGVNRLAPWLDLPHPPLYCCNTSQYKQFHRLKASTKLTVICSECKDIFKADDIVVSMYYLKRNILHFNIFGRRFGLRVPLVPSSIHKFIKISKHWSKLRKTHTQASTQSSMTMVTWDRNVFQKY